MAEEQLNLIDGMTPSLQRIYREAERLNSRMLTLRSNIKALEKPASLSYLRRELKTIEQQAKNTQLALKAVKMGEKQGIFSWNRRFQGIQYMAPYAGRQYMPVPQLLAYGAYIQNAQLRRNKALWDAGRVVPGRGTFDERLARLQSNSTMLNNSTNALSSFSGSLSMAIAKFVALYYVLDGLRNVGQMLINEQDKMVSMQTRLSLVNATPMTTQQFTEQLFNTAIRTRGSADATINLYNRIATSGVKASNERIRRFVETFNKSMVISGTSAQENRAVMLQLAQGMGSNRLGGDEFRSIAEQAPIFKYMLAKGMGVNPGALKQMGAEGKLTAEAIMTAMEKTQGLVDTIFEKMPWTIGQLGQVIQNKWLLIVNKNLAAYETLRKELINLIKWMDTQQGQQFFKDLFEGINGILKLIIMMTKILAPLFVWIIRHLQIIAKCIALISLYTAGSKLSKWALEGTSSVRLLAGSFELLSVAIRKATLALGAFFIGWEIGSKVREIIDRGNDFKYTDKGYLQIQKQREWNKYYNEQTLQYAQSRGLNTYMQAGTLKIKDETEGARSIRMKSLYDTFNTRWANVEQKYYANRAKNVQNQVDPYADLKAMLDPNKNKPMNVDKVNEVGRINSDVNLSTESIEMMKAIAERQWLIQNEVVVPQKVDVNMPKTSAMTGEQIAQLMNDGVQIAVASSMRGEVYA